MSDTFAVGFVDDAEFAMGIVERLLAVGSCGQVEFLFLRYEYLKPIHLIGFRKSTNSGDIVFGSGSLCKI